MFPKISELALVVALLCSLCYSQSTPASSSTTKLPTVQERVEVTATRTPEDPGKVPAAIEVFSGEELSARGATDLQSALAFATGVSIAHGGDAGPASSVPEFWGLKEFDAFLLVVDGVPWGGTFNPALTALSLSDVDRIEVLRGPAPVTYGATSFVGVIQVIHKDTTSNDRTLELHGGSFASGGGVFSTPIRLGGNWSSRLTLEGERLGFSDDRTAYRRGHGVWRVSRKPVEGNRLWFNTDLNWIDQDPASPRIREGATLSPLVPVDSNQNMAGAFLNDHRGTVMGGFDHSAFGGGAWSTSASVSHSRSDTLRGFLVAPEDAPDNAHGFREKIHLTDFYIDSHLAWKLPRSVRLLVGGDFLNGVGHARGADFDYTSSLSGSPAPVVPSPDDLDFHINDIRNFFGAYTSLEWSPFERLRFDAGVRLNATREHQQVIDGGAGTFEEQTRSDVRAGASLGSIFTLWQSKQDSLSAYVNYRDTFKPAAIDFGIGESAGGDLILKPETSRSVEGGLKGRFFDQRLEVEASGFLMHFNNLVTATNVGGVPALINAGHERFQGFESEMSLFLRHNVIAHATYSFHDATFTDFVQDFDGVPTQLAGKRIEMSARNLAAIGLTYAPVHGFVGNIDVNYIGGRFLNMRNTAPAGGFATVSLGAGYRTRRWELRADGRNLGDRRDPISESEFGDAQYYLMPARRADVTLKLHF
jgi:iron complex outermembrane recepter protein